MIKNVFLVGLILGGILSGCSPASVDLPITAKPTLSAGTRVEGAQKQALPPTLPTIETLTATPAGQPAPATPTFASTPARAASATPTTSPATVSDLVRDCLVGTWEVTQLSQALAESFAASRSTFHLQQADGTVLYQFSPDGEMNIHFEHLSATLNGVVEKRQVSAQQSLDGSATAHYQVDAAGKQITLSNFGGEGIQFGLDINGQRLVEGSLPVWKAFTSGIANQNASPVKVVQESHTEASCSGDTLKMQAKDPLSGPELDLHRVK